MVMTFEIHNFKTEHILIHISSQGNFEERVVLIKE